MNCLPNISFNRVSLMAVFVALQLLMPFEVHANQPEKLNKQQCDCKSSELLLLQHKPITADNIIKWSKAAVTTTFSYGFGNYQTVFDNASGFFTPKGWAEYKRALYKSGNLEAVKSNKLVVSSQLTSLPRITKTHSTTQGQEIWEVQIPIQVSYQNALHTLKQNIVVTLQIDKAPNAKSMKDIGISQFIAEPETA